MKNLILIPLILLSGCSTLGVSERDCLTKAYAVELGISQSYDATTRLYLAGTLSKTNAIRAVKSIDTANALVDSAKSFCPVDTAKAAVALSEAESHMAEVKSYTGV